jgi:hypothetical protein
VRHGAIEARRASLTSAKANMAKAVEEEPEIEQDTAPPAVKNDGFVRRKLALIIGGAFLLVAAPALRLTVSAFWT